MRTLRCVMVGSGRVGGRARFRAYQRVRTRPMIDPLFDLSGRTAVVSGASRGIGEAIAHLLASHGAHVVCASRKLEGCEEVAAAIRAAGGSAEAQAMHVGDTASIEALFASLDAAGRAPAILVNNAAANPYFGP